jgi:hypothetical protein
MEDLDEVPASEVEACVNRMLELAQADAGRNLVDANTRFNLAKALYKRKLDPQLQVEMARKGQASASPAGTLGFLLLT